MFLTAELSFYTSDNPNKCAYICLRLFIVGETFRLTIEDDRVFTASSDIMLESPECFNKKIPVLNWFSIYRYIKLAIWVKMF